MSPAHKSCHQRVGSMTQLGVQGDVADVQTLWVLCTLPKQLHPKGANAK